MPQTLKTFRFILLFTGLAALALPTAAAADTTGRIKSESQILEEEFGGPELTVAEAFNEEVPFEISFAKSNLDSYTEGLPLDLAQTERSFGQVDPAFEPEKPIVWLKVSFDRKNTLRSRLSDMF